MGPLWTPTLVAIAPLACALAATASDLGRPTIAETQHVEDIARIEAPRRPGAEGHAGMTLEGIMQELDIPALSVAVVRDFEVI